MFLKAVVRHSAGGWQSNYLSFMYTIFGEGCRYWGYMKQYSIIILAAAVLTLTACGGGRKTAVADSRYRREPIREVSEALLKADSRLIDAIGKQESGHVDEALQAYAALAKDEPQYAAAWYQMSLLLAERNWTDSAMACIERAVKLSPDNRWYLLHKAALHKERGEAREAVATWERLVKLMPDELEYCYNLSNACLDANDLDGAVAALDRVERRVGVTEPISLQKQRIWMAAGKQAKAEQELVRLADAMPHEKRYQAMLAEMYMGQGKIKKAKERYDMVLRADPQDPYIHIQMAEYYKKTGNAAEADSEMVRAFANPALDSRTKVQLLGSFYTDEEFFGSHSATAFRLLDMAMAQGDATSEMSAFYGQVLLRQGKYDEAARQLESALAHDSTSYGVWELLLVSLSELPQREDDMAAYAERAARLFPMQVLPKYLQALVHVRHERYSEALELLKKASMWGFNKGYLEAECTGLTAECQYRVGNYAEAWKAFERYLELRPDDWNTMNNYAWYMAEQGVNLEKALALSRRTVDADPKNANSLDTYGWLLHLLGRDAEARPWLERAVRLAPNSDTLREHLETVK